MSTLCTRCSINSDKDPTEIESWPASWPNIFTTTRPPLVRSMGNLLSTKAFKSGSSSKVKDQRVFLASDDQSVTSQFVRSLVSEAAPMRTNERQTEPLSFRLGDYLAGILTGVLTALAVRAIVGPNWDMVVAMLIGMGTGMSVHLSLLVLLIPLLGTFEVMMPSGIIGMYGGMLFGMRDAMQQEVISLSQAPAVGGLFGFVVVFVIRWWDRQLRGVTFVGSNSRRTL